jgi:hypothetical protein
MQGGRTKNSAQPRATYPQDELAEGLREGAVGGIDSVRRIAEAVLDARPVLKNR